MSANCFLEYSVTLQRKQQEKSFRKRIDHPRTAGENTFLPAPLIVRQGKKTFPAGNSSNHFESVTIEKAVNRSFPKSFLEAWLSRLPFFPIRTTVSSNRHLPNLLKPNSAQKGTPFIFQSCLYLFERENSMQKIHIPSPKQPVSFCG